MEQRLSIITLGVRDLNRSRLFYEKLGWEIATKEDSENIIAFNLQGMSLVLFPLDELEKDTGVKMSSHSYPPFTLAYNTRSKDEVNKVIELAKKIGAKILKEPQEVFWGGYSGYFLDPDNFLWEVAYNPFSKLGEKGEFTWG